MYRIRFHGRGGQGIKTASRILGTAFFLEGFEVQDAPRYGAERRGAPIFAYVRAGRQVIQERGIIRNPNLVIVADETLLPIPAAAVLQGVGAQTVMLIISREPEQVWQGRLNLAGPIYTLPVPEEVKDRVELHHIGTICAAAASRLVGAVSWTILVKALRKELVDLGDAVVKKNLAHARQAYELMQPHQGRVTTGSAVSAKHFTRPDWVDLAFEDARVSAPAIHASVTSELVKTGLWRTIRPVIDCAHCKRCWWVCSTFCPEGAIQVDEAGRPRIDYDHCKGCMVCLVQCPHHAIQALSERDVQKSKSAWEAK